ncbi:MAG: hypothetical protein DRH04_04385, partial [Deltaproteobacteria bacterium]
GAVQFHQNLAEKVSSRPRHLSVVAGTDGDPLPYRLTLVDDQNNVLGSINPENGKVAKEIPFSDYLVFTDQDGLVTGQMALVSTPRASSYTIRLERTDSAAPGTPFSLSLVLPADTESGLRQVAFENITGNTIPVIQPEAGDPCQITVEIIDNGSPTQGPALDPSYTESIADPPPTLISIVQQADADRVHCCKAEDCSMAGVQVGRIVALLFSEEVTAESVQDQFELPDITNYDPEENEVVAVSRQPGGRIVFLGLRHSVGPFVERQITITNAVDRRGHTMLPWTGPMEATITEEGGLLTGKILNADGTPVNMAEVRLFLWNGKCGWAGISTRRAGVDGSYSWDFVVKNRKGKIVAIDPLTGESRSVEFQVSRHGQHLNINVTFLGRGTLAGRTLAEDGFTLLPDTQIKVTSLTDYSQYSATSDENSNFIVQNIPTGSLIIEAVHTESNSQVTLTEYMTAAGEMLERDLVLITEETREITVQYGTLSGHVLEGDGATPVAGVPVVAYYKTGSQEGVACPAPGPPYFDCPVAITTTDENGSFTFAEIVAGELRLYTFEQSRFVEGMARTTLPADGEEEVNILLADGLGTVQGIVLDADGNPVANAEVGGGISLTTTDENGIFILEDVPVGKRTIVAVSRELGANGQATIDLVAEGEQVYATIVLSAMGSVAGTIFEPDGVTPVPNLAVYLWEAGQDRTIDVVATTTTDADGHYFLEKVPVSSRYKLSAFLSDFSAGNIEPVTIQFNGQTVRTDIVFIGSGRINGIIYDDDGVTPLNAQVGLSCIRLQRAGPVGTKFIYTPYARILESDFTTGTFSFDNVFVGPFALATAGAFNQQMTTGSTPFGPQDVIDPATLAGIMPYDGAILDVTLQLTPTSRIEGTVYQADGVTPVGPDIQVTFKGYKIYCTLNGCFELESGIQEEIVVTDDDGHYLLPVVNAGKFELRAHDLATGDLGQIRGTVQAGQTAEIDLRLLNTSEVVVTVYASNGTDRIPEAEVDIQHAVILDVEAGLVNNAGFLGIERSGTADSQGEISFAGGDALPEGELVVLARDPNTGFTGRANGRITMTDDTIQINVYLFNATGSVYGTVYQPDGLTPVANAEVVIANHDGSLGFFVTDEEGAYQFDLMPLGDFEIKVFEAATGRRGIAFGSIDLANQEVPLNIIQAPIGFVTGTALAAGDLTPLAGWNVEISQPGLTGEINPLSGSSWTIWRGTTGIDGSFLFPGIPIGTFYIKVEKSGLGEARVESRITRENELVDIPVVVNLIQEPEGTIAGWVYNPDGTPAPNAEICLDYCPPVGRGTTTNDTGTFHFDNVPLGRHKILAKSQVSEDSGYALAELAFTGETTHPVIILAGTGTITGNVEWQDGSPARGVELNLFSNPIPACPPACKGCPPVCTAFADENGTFQFINIPAGTITIEAINPVNPDISGTNGSILAPGDTADIRIVLEPVGTVTGIVHYGDNLPASGIVAKLELTNPPAWTPPLIVYSETDTNGAFSFGSIPVGDPIGIYRLTLTDPIGIGTATRMISLPAQGTSVDLGTVVMDDSRPEITTMTPLPDAVSVPRTQLIQLTFSEPLEPGTVNLDSITVTKENGEQVAGFLTIGEGDTLVTFTPLEQFDHETRFTVRVSANPPFANLSDGASINRAAAARCYAVLVHFDEYDSDGNGYLSEDEYPAGVQDRSGHTMAEDFVATFTTVDITAPTVLSISPTPDTGGVSVDSVIRIIYTEPVDP